VSGGTVFPCIVMHFNHRVSQPVEVRTISKLANHHHDRTTNRQLTMILAFEKTLMKCPLASTTGSDDTRRDKNSSNTTDRLVSFSTCYTTCNLFSTCLQVIIWPSSQHVVEDCELVAAAERRQLRSSDIATFVIPRTYTRLGDRAFTFAGPRMWNSLPSNLRQSDLTRHQFRRALTTYLFG